MINNIHQAQKLDKKQKIKKIKKYLSVGDVANRLDVAVSTIHYYESLGLLYSMRNVGNHRRFTRDVLRRVAVIKVAKNLGIPLERIKQSFNHLPFDRSPTKADWTKISKGWKVDLQARITQLTKLKENLNSCIGCGCLSLDQCQLMNKDDVLGQTQKGVILIEENAQ